MYYTTNTKEDNYKRDNMTKAQYSTVTSKGQITIPHVIRDQMNLSSGSKLEFLNKGDYIVILPLNKSVKNLKGILPTPEVSLSCEEMNEIIRGNSQ